ARGLASPESAQFHAAADRRMAERTAAQPERQARPRHDRRRLDARRVGMKPHGSIPPGFVADADGMLLIGGARAETLADAAGDTPLFVYDSAMLTARGAEWRAAMPAEVQLHYAMKANPYAPLLAFMAGLVDGFDVASGGELKAALASGMVAADISFAGPGKRDRE